MKTKVIGARIALENQATEETIYMKTSVEQKREEEWFITKG